MALGDEQLLVLEFRVSLFPFGLMLSVIIGRWINYKQNFLAEKGVI